MNDKSALLEQLRLHRGDAAAATRGGAIKWIGAGAAALALVGVGAWLLLGRAGGAAVRVAVAQD